MSVVYSQGSQYLLCNQCGCTHVNAEMLHAHTEYKTNKKHAGLLCPRHCIDLRFQALWEDGAKRFLYLNPVLDQRGLYTVGSINLRPELIKSTLVLHQLYMKSFLNHLDFKYGKHFK